MPKDKMTEIELIATPDAPKPGGHYSQATATGDLVFVSGQLPVTPGGEHRPRATLEDQAWLVLANVQAVLAAAGCGWTDVLKVTVYIAGVEHWPAFNAVYAQVLAEARPARSVVPVPALHHGYLVELDAIARRP